MIIVQLHVYFNYIFLIYLFEKIYQTLTKVFPFNIMHVDILAYFCPDLWSTMKYEIQLLNLTDMNYL